MEEEDFGIAKAVMRQLYRLHRPFSVRVLDRYGQHVLTVSLNTIKPNEKHVFLTKLWQFRLEDHFPSSTLELNCFCPLNATTIQSLLVNASSNGICGAVVTIYSFSK